MAARGVLRTLEGGKLAFWCQGCKCSHAVDERWQFNGNFDKPTLHPSILIDTGHYRSGHTGDCWCTYNEAHPDNPSPFKCGRCHTFVTDGNIQFLPDCTHHLAGKTIALEPF